MKIAFDVSYIQRTRAGIGRHAFQLLRSLLASDRSNQYVLHGWSFGIDRESLSALVKSNAALSIARIPGSVKRLYWNRLRFPPIESFVGMVDIVHSTDPLLPPTRAKKICTVHDVAYKKFPSLFERRVLSWDRAVQRSVHSADAIIVPSEQSRVDVCETFGVDEGRTHIVQLPVGEEFSAGKKPAADDEVLKNLSLAKPYMLFVGTMEPRKNIPALVHALEIVRENGLQDIDLVLVGRKGWNDEGIFRAITTSRARSSIHHIGYAADSDLASLYRRALFFVYPSLHEGYGFPVLEAMASGTPVITSMNSSMRELADGVGVLIDPTNTDELVEAMTSLITDEVRRVEMRHRGLQAVRRYTPDAAARKVLDIYAALGV